MDDGSLCERALQPFNEPRPPAQLDEASFFDVRPQRPLHHNFQIFWRNEGIDLGKVVVLFQLVAIEH